MDQLAIARQKHKKVNMRVLAVIRASISRECIPTLQAVSMLTQTVASDIKLTRFSSKLTKLTLT